MSLSFEKNLINLKIKKEGGDNLSQKKKKKII